MSIEELFTIDNKNNNNNEQQHEMEAILFNFICSQLSYVVSWLALWEKLIIEFKTLLQVTHMNNMISSRIFKIFYIIIEWQSCKIENENDSYFSFSSSLVLCTLKPLELYQ